MLGVAGLDYTGIWHHEVLNDPFQSPVVRRTWIYIFDGTPTQPCTTPVDCVLLRLPLIRCWKEFGCSVCNI